MLEAESVGSLFENPKKLAQRALEANRTLQDLLTRHAERLQAELREVDRLLSVATIEDAADEAEPDIQIPGGNKASAPFPSYELLKPESPFFEDASRKARYINDTTLHPMRPRELEVLADAVYSENKRLQALQDQATLRGSRTHANIDIENNIEGLDWNIIAEKVSDVSTYKRSAEECRIKWLGELRPQINRDDWTAEEVDKLKDIIAESEGTGEGKFDWVKISEKLGTNRTPIECMKQGIPRPRHIWSSDSDQKLLAAIDKYGTDNWAIVARSISEHVTPTQCQTRYAKTLDPSIKRGVWSVDEDNRLRKAVTVYGNSWTDIAKCITGRTNDQCRERWSEQLNTSSKGEWREEDDNALREAYKTMGNQWKAISQKLGIGKTDSQCRIRYAKLKKLDENASAPKRKPRARPTKKVNEKQAVTETDIGAHSSGRITPSAPTDNLYSIAANGKASNTTPPLDPSDPNQAPGRAEQTLSTSVAKQKPSVRSTGKRKEAYTETESGLLSGASPANMDGDSTAASSSVLTVADTRLELTPAVECRESSATAPKRRLRPRPTRRSKETTISTPKNTEDSTISHRPSVGAARTTAIIENSLSSAESEEVSMEASKKRAGSPLLDDKASKKQRIDETLCNEGDDVILTRNEPTTDESVAVPADAEVSPNHEARHTTNITASTQPSSGNEGLPKDGNRTASGVPMIERSRRSARVAAKNAGSGKATK